MKYSDRVRQEIEEEVTQKVTERVKQELKTEWDKWARDNNIRTPQGPPPPPPLGNTQRFHRYSI